MPLPSESKLLNSVDAAKRTDFWIAGVKPGISKQNLKFGTGIIEFLPKNILKGGDENAPLDEGPIITFGKYKGKSAKWVRDNDGSYWDWAVENVAAIRKISDEYNL